jgi:hypothetical protein
MTFKGGMKGGLKFPIPMHQKDFEYLAKFFPYYSDKNNKEMDKI